MKRLRRVVANKVTADKVADDYRGDYRLLDRLRSDCEYFLNYGNHNVKHLWAGNVEDQIQKMYEIYDRLPEKPDWLTRRDIDMYYEQMCESSYDLGISQKDALKFLSSLPKSKLGKTFYDYNTTNIDELSYTISDEDLYALGYQSSYGSTDGPVTCSSVNKKKTPFSQSYRGFRIRLLDDGSGYAIFDSEGEMEDYGFRSVEDAKKFVDELVDSNDERTDYEIEHGITYTRSYSNKYGDQISIFVYDDDPDKQEYGEGGPSGDYFRGKWTQNMQDYYTRKGFKLDSASDLDASYITASEDIDALWEVIDDEEFEFRGVQDVGYDNDGNIMVVFNHGLREDMIEPTAEDLLIAFRQYGYPVHQWDTNGTNVFILSRGSILGSVDTDDDDDYIKEIPQEFTSKNTSINITKVPAIFRSVRNWTPGTINLDYGGGRADTATEYLSQYDVQNLIYDPYNRTKGHNSEVIRTIRKAGGADTATCSNVLNVIKEPEVRRNALINISKLVKPGGYVYFTTYEGSGKGDERPTGKESYQLNRKTDWYLDEIREVFPDAIRRGKLIIATNSRSVNSSNGITATSKLWMGKYKSAKDNKMHRVYFEFDTSDFEEAAQEFEDIVPEPYSYARLLGTAPDEALLQKDGFEKIEASDTSYIKNSDSTEGYVYTYCDECGKKNRVKVTFNNFNEPFNDTEFKCKYCGTSNLLTDPHSYDENGNVVEASHDEICKTPSINDSGDILSFICPICQNDTVYSAEKDIYHPYEVDYEELFICDECGAELKAYPKYDGTINFIPLMNDEY